jgi:uncharacterized membrane protein required for colicin V production
MTVQYLTCFDVLMYNSVHLRITKLVIAHQLCLYQVVLLLSKIQYSILMALIIAMVQLLGSQTTLISHLTAVPLVITMLYIIVAQSGSKLKLYCK